MRPPREPALGIAERIRQEVAQTDLGPGLDSICVSSVIASWCPTGRMRHRPLDEGSERDYAVLCEVAETIARHHEYQDGRG